LGLAFAVGLGRAERSMSLKYEWSVNLKYKSMRLKYEWRGGGGLQEQPQAVEVHVHGQDHLQRPG